jgi:hypothetical protein
MKNPSIILKGYRLEGVTFLCGTENDPRHGYRIVQIGGDLDGRILEERRGFILGSSARDLAKDHILRLRKFYRRELAEIRAERRIAKAEKEVASFFGGASKKSRIFSDPDFAAKRAARAHASFGEED